MNNTKRTTSKLPDKYKTCDWLWNYGSIGLTKEHINRLNNAINILESLNENTDTKYLKEIKDKLLEDTLEIEKTNTDAFIDRACEWLKKNVTYTHPRKGTEECVVNLSAFIEAMKGE